jgi:uncharacterized protein (TIGR04255 family)
MGTVATIECAFGDPITSVPLKHSPLSFVVAQVRFPTVVSIDTGDFIGPFQELIRSEYGDLRRDVEGRVAVGPEGISAEQGVVWRFSQLDGDWEVALTSDFVALATNRYTNRADFHSRFEFLLVALDKWLAPRKARRLGVRYINRLTGQDLDKISELVRSDVLGPYGSPTPDTVSLHHSLTDCEYRLGDDTGFRARWGVLDSKTTFDVAVEPLEVQSWVLDLDAWRGEQDFNIEELRSQVSRFGEVIYRYFRWAVTEEFIEAFKGRE